jgi:hypothetical protein
MDEKDKGKTQNIQCTKKNKGQKGDETMKKKDKRQIQAIQWTKKTKDKHRRYNGQKR